MPGISDPAGTAKQIASVNDLSKQLDDVTADHDELSANLTAAQDLLKDAQAVNTALAEENTQLKTDVAAAKEAVEKLETAVTEQASALLKLQADLDAATAAQADLATKLADAEAEKTNLKAGIDAAEQVAIEEGDKAAAVSDQFVNLAKHLTPKGKTPEVDEVAPSDEAETKKDSPVIAIYKRLSASQKPEDKLAKARLYNANKEEIDAYKASRLQEKDVAEDVVAPAVAELTDQERAHFDEYTRIKTELDAVDADGSKANARQNHKRHAELKIELRAFLRDPEKKTAVERGKQVSDRSARAV